MGDCCGWVQLQEQHKTRIVPSVSSMSPDQKALVHVGSKHKAAAVHAGCSPVLTTATCAPPCRLFGSCLISCRGEPSVPAAVERAYNPCPRIRICVHPQQLHACSMLRVPAHGCQQVLLMLINLYGYCVFKPS